ncbi:MAG: amino acid permease [Elusimicrobia bacterium]|nr:amino acid permease [Elusimicrobiota bacterium]
MSDVVVLTTAMLTFISFWRAGAIVLCDLASTAWYVGGITEQAIGKAAPWFILAVMSFSACMIAVYVESSAMFVRGGVYKVVRRAMGSTLAKIAVSALMFDYVLTGPISSVSAGQYLAGLLNEVFPLLRIGWHVSPNLFSVAFALSVTLYFWRQNILGIEESSEKSLFIVKLTAVMGVLLLGWSAYTIHARGFSWPPLNVTFGKNALGWLEGADWVRTIGAVGLLVGLGHAFLGMSGLETLAQVYREMEAPKLKNLKKAAVFIFLFAFILTTASSFLATSIIPDADRVRYLDNLLGGLAMFQEGPRYARLLLQTFVVVVGAMILSGAVNTSIVGANSVLGRVAEDGILADWFRWLHPKYGTTHRTINLVAGLQVAAILISRGDVYFLGEAYAFGLLWSFVFLTASGVILRFKDRAPREWMVPLNIPVGPLRFPAGMILILLVLLAAATTNLFTKNVATVWGGMFTLFFYGIFKFSEKLNERRQREAEEHREKVNFLPHESLQGVLDDVERPRKMLVALRDPIHMFALRKALETVDADTTEIVVLHARRAAGLRLGGEMGRMSPEEERLFTQVIDLAEKHGKKVLPVLVASTDPMLAVAQTAQAMGAEEVILGASNVMTAETQIERLAMAWGAVAQRSDHPVKVVIWRPDGGRAEFPLA